MTRTDRSIRGNNLTSVSSALLANLSRLSTLDMRDNAIALVGPNAFATQLPVMTKLFVAAWLLAFWIDETNFCLRMLSLFA